MSESRETELIKAIIDNLDDSETEYTKTPQSRNEEILVSILNETEYTKTPQSREEELLLELKEKIGGLVPPVPPVIKRVTGNPIEFEDGADAPLVKCTTAIQGNQDLHGYDKPWIGGAGKNKYGNGDQSFTQAKQNIELLTPLSAGTYIFGALVESSDTDNTDCLVQLVGSGGAILAGGRISRGVTNRTYLVLSWSGNDAVKLNLYAAASYVNGAGDTASFADIQIESGYTATAYSPYSNICPITAYSQSTISVCRHNFYETTNTEAQATSGKVTIISQDSIRVQRNGASGGTYPASKQLLNMYSLESGKTYQVKAYADITSGIAEIAIRDTSNNPVSASIQITESGWLDVLFTYNPSTDYYLSFFATYNSSVGGDITYSNIKFYEVTTHTATFSNSIYQGNADFVGSTASGKKKLLVFDGTEEWTTRSVSVGALYELPIDVEGLSGSEFSIESISNMYVNDTNLTNSGMFRLLKSSNTVAMLTIHDDSVGSLANFKTFLSTNNLQLVYTLTNETTEQVTPTNLPIKSLFGYNHIESSTGDMTIDYITEGYQNFVDTVESALPNTTRNLLTASKGGTKAMDIFLSLENWDAKEEVKEEDGEDKKEVDEIQNGVKEEIMDDR